MLLTKEFGFRIMFKIEFIREGPTDLENLKIVFISGASSGIGEATARHLAQKNYRVILGARRLDRLNTISNEIRQAGGEATAMYLDVANLESIHNAVSDALSEYGKIDILVNNAGFGRLRWLEELDPKEDIYSQIQVNLVGMIWLTQSVLPGMIAQRSGHIINIASLASFIGMPTYSIYAASKFGVRGFSEALRREVRIWGINVTGLYPGAVDYRIQNQLESKSKNRHDDSKIITAPARGCSPSGRENHSPTTPIGCYSRNISTSVMVELALPPIGRPGGSQ